MQFADKADGLAIEHNFGGAPRMQRRMSRFDKLSTTLRSLDDDGDGQPELRYRANYGSSFVLALQFDAAGPKAERFLSYGQSHDPESPHFTDQTEQFARQQWQPMRFTEQEIAAHQERTLHLKVLRTTNP